jgi:type I restriction enzyme M protein
MSAVVISADAQLNPECTYQTFLVPAEENPEKGWDVVISRNKEIVYEELEYEESEYDPPQKIIEELEVMKREMQHGLRELTGMIG